MKPKNRSHFILPDCQIKPGVPNKQLEWAGRYAADRKPDVIVCLGDFWDMPSLSSYDAGKKSFEGRMYKADIEAGRAAMDLFMRPIRKMKLKPRLIFLLGNHECVQEDTEILTTLGWIPAKHLTPSHEVASFSQDRLITYAPPLNLKHYETPTNLLSLNSNPSEELVSDNHKFIVDGVRTSLVGVQKLKANRLTHSGYLAEPDSRLSDDKLRLLTWVVTDGCIFRSSPGKVRVQFKLSKARKIQVLRKLLDELKIPYTFRAATKCGVNKLQPYFIRIYGSYAEDIETSLGGVKQFPRWFANLEPAQTRVVVNTIAITDGSYKDRGVHWNTTSLPDAEIIQLACIQSGMPCHIKKARPNTSGFRNGKQLYHVFIWLQDISSKFDAVIMQAGVGYVVGIQTKDGTLITRRNGKVAFTGNSRIDRAVESDRKLEGTMGYHDFQLEKDGWEVQEFLKPITLDGVSYSHFYPRSANGAIMQTKRGAPDAKAQLQREGRSCIAGHQQGLSVSCLPLGGHLQWSIIAGSYYLHDEVYLSPQGNDHWRGLVVLHNVRQGCFDPMFVGIDYLEQRYGTKA